MDTRIEDAIQFFPVDESELLKYLRGVGILQLPLQAFLGRLQGMYYRLGGNENKNRIWEQAMGHGIDIPWR
jgi:hypothetical protein